MSKLFAFTLLLASAAEAEQKSVDPLAEYLWIARPLVIFAPSDDDPRLAIQKGFIENGADALKERDVVVIIDTDAASPLRKDLRPRDFQVVLIGKDGDVKLRKPFPWDARELSRAIDKMPLRQQELRARPSPSAASGVTE